MEELKNCLLFRQRLQVHGDAQRLHTAAIYEREDVRHRSRGAQLLRRLMQLGGELAYLDQADILANGHAQLMVDPHERVSELFARLAVLDVVEEKQLGSKLVARARVSQDILQSHVGTKAVGRAASLAKSTERCFSIESGPTCTNCHPAQGTSEDLLAHNSQ